MTSVIRYTTIVNSTGAVLTPETGLVTSGKEGSDKLFRRVFSAADVGTGAGQTRDGTDPTMGCLLVSITGATIKGVFGDGLYRPTAATNATFDRRLYATVTPQVVIYGFRISPDGKSVYILDSGSAAATQIAVNDYLTFSLVVGNY